MIEYAMKKKYRLFMYNCSDIYQGCQQCQQMTGIFGVFDNEFDFSSSLLGNFRCRW